MARIALDTWHRRRLLKTASLMTEHRWQAEKLPSVTRPESSESIRLTRRTELASLSQRQIQYLALPACFPLTPVASLIPRASRQTQYDGGGTRSDLEILDGDLISKTQFFSVTEFFELRTDLKESFKDRFSIILLYNWASLIPSRSYIFTII